MIPLKLGNMPRTVLKSYQRSSSFKKLSTRQKLQLS